MNCSSLSYKAFYLVHVWVTFVRTNMICLCHWVTVPGLLLFLWFLEPVPAHHKLPWASMYKLCSQNSFPVIAWPTLNFDIDPTSYFTNHLSHHHHTSLTLPQRDFYLLIFWQSFIINIVFFMTFWWLSSYQNINTWGSSILPSPFHPPPPSQPCLRHMFYWHGHEGIHFMAKQLVTVKVLLRPGGLTSFNSEDSSECINSSECIVFDCDCVIG